MMTFSIAPTPERSPWRQIGAGLSRRRVRVAVALAFTALLTLVTMPGVVLAGGGGALPGVVLTPSSGPVGAHVTASGSNFGSDDKITIGYSKGNCGADVVTITGASGTARGDGKVTIVFTWPSDTPAGKYTVCAIDNTTGKTYPAPAPFEVLSANPPTITINGSVRSGEKVQVTGANFLPGGGTVDISYGPAGSSGCATPAGSATVGVDGSFTSSFDAPFTASDETIVVTAVEPQGECGKAPVLEAHTNASILAKATPTPTATATPPPATTPNPNPNPPLPWPPTWPPSGAWTVVYCLVGLLVLLLLLLLLLLLFRRRKKDEPVTIEERDTVMVNANASRAGGAAGAAGSTVVQRQIVARDAKGNVSPIAEEVFSTEEEIVDDPGQGPGGYPPRR